MSHKLSLLQKMTTKSMDPATVVDVCTYHRRDFDLVLVPSLPFEKQIVLDFLQIFNDLSTTSLGTLEILPNEILNIILRSLDLHSYLQFRNSSRRARNYSNELHEFQLVVKNGLECLRNLVRVRLAKSSTIRDLYSALTRENCVYCNEFGGFLFLPHITRCCFSCIRNSPELRVITLSTFSRLTNILPKRLHNLLGNTLRTVPGIYSFDRHPAKRPASLLAELKSLTRLSALGLLTQDACHLIGLRYDKEVYRFMSCTVYPWYDVRTGGVEYGLNCKGCEIQHEKGKIPICDRDRVFAKSSYLSHFELCTEAQNLFTAKQNKLKGVKESDFIDRGGHSNVLDNEWILRL